MEKSGKKWKKVEKSGKVDLHAMIGKRPRPKRGWTPPANLFKPFGEHYKYMGPYNPLDEQLKYDPKTGKIIDFYEKHYNEVDEIAAHHDICYVRGVDKHECDKTMVESFDQVPNLTKWGQTAHFLINSKQKLGLGVSKNGKSRRVSGKKN